MHDRPSRHSTSPNESAARRRRAVLVMSVTLTAAVIAAGLGWGSATAGTVGTATTDPGTFASATSDAHVRLALPAPTSRRQIGTVSLHLVDASRQDPWLTPSAPRELMISLWYPATAAATHPYAPWYPPVAMEAKRQYLAGLVHTPLNNVDFPTTHGHEGAPVEVTHGGHPVVLYSPGYQDERELNTALVEELASRGYVVVTIDHTHDSRIVEFPGGRVEPSLQPRINTPADLAQALSVALPVREQDTSFVLDVLARLNAGANPDAEHHTLPRGIKGALDLSRVGMFGHSLGGDTTAETMARDSRIRAGVDMDGTINGPVATTGLDQPFMLMAAADHARDTDQSWAQLWSNLRGWRLNLQLADSGHLTYTDLSPVGQQLLKFEPIPAEVINQVIRPSIGTIDAGTAITDERAYLVAFFDLHLCHRNDGLLSGPSPLYPQVRFIP